MKQMPQTVQETWQLVECIEELLPEWNKNKDKICIFKIYFSKS